MPLADLLRRLQTEPNDTINAEDREALGRLLHIPQDQLERMAADQIAATGVPHVTVHGQAVHVGTPGLTTPAPTPQTAPATTPEPETPAAPVTLEAVQTLIREELAAANQVQQAETPEAEEPATETVEAAPDDAIAQITALRAQVEASEAQRQQQSERQERERQVRENHPHLLGIMNILHDMSASTEQIQNIAESMPAGDDPPASTGDGGPGPLETSTGAAGTGSQQTETAVPTETNLRDRAMEIIRTLPGERTPELRTEFDRIQNQRFQLNQQLPLSHPRRLPSEQMPDEEVARLRLVRREADEALTMYENGLEGYLPE